MTVTVELLDQPPPLSTGSWKDVVDINVPAPAGELRVTGLTAETDAEHLLPALSHAGPGTYRLRVHARGRDTDPAASENYDWDAVEEDVVDDYDDAEDQTDPADEFLIAVWPASHAPPVSHKLTGVYGAELRGASL
ncbi:hypothetical protein [Actinomadura rayongensis]|uniref:Uncharacterized protein n=1 Tax=Actinomadura rayongensis TaxID=1429076 RepID=A0A6I4WN15_9ACTN|nr:hypothetical protein [Actinomadura rayongensis]MXQ68334.1 hypothetical protein [Actinomadura rayongensis]